MNETLKRFFTAATEKFHVLLTRFNQFSRREKNIFIVAAALVFLVAVNYGLVGPLQGGLKSMAEKIKVEEKKTIYNMRNVAQKPQIDLIYLRLLENIGMSGSSSDEIRDSMLHDIEQYARAHNISLTEVKPQVSAEHENFREFYLRAQAEGAMTDLMAFFTDLIRANKLYYIDGLRINSHQEDVNKIKANVSIGRAVLLGKKTG